MIQQITNLYFRKLLSITLLSTLGAFYLTAQEIPDLRVLETQELASYLKTESQNKLVKGNEITTAKLAEHMREKFAQNFFYDYKSFDDRLINYIELYGNDGSQKRKAYDHMDKYPDSTQWVLPFNYQNGEPVNAYALRHLARQHKMVDIALNYFLDDRDPNHIKYFENQMQSLNVALEKDLYETIEDGNGVYEVYRSGYRIFNWLWIHNMFLNEEEYGDEDQLRTIATLLQHGQHLYERNSEFKFGNHQTKGMSALAMLSILLQDFKGTDKWFDRAMTRLGEHLDKEVNNDGFQFERSVHYHMSDINNYFYVYQLAKINQIDVDKNWEEKLKTLFTTLVKIAYPDKSAPVLQDDTEIPWAEKNDISGAMTLGYLLFDDPEFGYFAQDVVPERVYWFLSESQIAKLKNIEKQEPEYGSLAFKDTHYYIMREGWEKNDNVMVISAGLDPDKPDHQHGDMLGIQAIANSQIILPNYQVRYSLADFELFKNSMVKNVALVDDELQGKMWTSNKGGSGFGKFKQLPQPEVIAWESNDNFDFFAGSHDGFENVSVDYSRQVISIKDDFWIIKDNFHSPSSHEYKQIWQGHYTSEDGSNLLRASFSDASGCDILQLNETDSFITSGTRGKHWTVVSKNDQTEFDFITVIFPYKKYNNRIDETSEEINLGDWLVKNTEWEISGSNPTSITKEDENYFFGVNEITLGSTRIITSEETDIYIKLEKENLVIYSIGKSEVTLTIEHETTKETIQLKPGETYTFSLGN